jgi:hypothetical protein
LPAWQLHLDNALSEVYVLAVAAAGRFPHAIGDGQPGEGQAVLSADGRSLTIAYDASRPLGECQAAYTSSLQVTQTTTTVLLAVTIHITAYPVPPPGVICPFSAQPPPSASPLTPGAPHTRTITLDQPLGARVVIGAAGLPYEVTSS